MFTGMSEALQVFEALEVSEVMCCVLLCMLEAVDDELCLLEELGVMRCLLEDAVWRVGSGSWFQKSIVLWQFSRRIPLFKPWAGPFDSRNAFLPISSRFHINPSPIQNSLTLGQ